MSMPRSTRAMIDLCPLYQGCRPERLLDVGSHQGAVALALGAAYLHDDLTACEEARATGVGAVHHADSLPHGPFDAIFFDGRTFAPGLAADLVAEAAARLTRAGALITTVHRSDLEPYFAVLEEHGEAVVARSPRADAAAHDAEPFAYALTLGEATHTIATAPGLFSPRSLDPGTAALLDLITATPGERFLDLGCGAGVVSLVAARLWGCQVTAVDVSARALRLTRLNVPEAEVLASSGFAALSGRQFHRIASNPPYHTDFAVAKAFIEGAYGHLLPDGWLYLVVKRADWYVEKVRAVFGGCRVTERDGYAIIMAERRASRPQPAKKAKQPTRKHLKRMGRKG